MPLSRLFLKLFLAALGCGFWMMILGVYPLYTGLHPPLFQGLALVFWGYGWGSLLGGPMMARLFHLGDLKQLGSGNVGATNVLRTGNKMAALLTVLFDGGKPFLALYTLGLFEGAHGPFVASPETMVLLVAFGTFMGHLFPLFSKDFNGGKGIATLGGLSWMISWPMGASLTGLWLIIANRTGYSSLAGILSTLAAIPLAYGLVGTNAMILFAFLAPFVLVRHQENIRRLMKGTETKIGKNRG